MDGDVFCPGEFADSLQRLPQDCALDLELGRIPCLLVMATSTLPKIRTASVDSGLRWLQKLIERGPRKPSLFFQNGDIHLFTGQDKRDKHGFALWVAGQAVAAIDHFFDGQVHM